MATDELREYDPATPIHQGWKTYTYSLREVDTDGGESSLERAMRLRQELLDLLEECCEASTPTSSLFEDNTQVHIYKYLTSYLNRCWCIEATSH